WRAGRRGQDALCGVALGLACTMKLFPGLMVLLLVVARRWRAVAAAAAAYLGVAAIMTARFGLGSWAFFFDKQPKIANQWLDSLQNQSLHGVVLRLFHPVCGPHGPPLAVATALSVALSLALVALGAWWAYRAVRTTAGWDVAFALIAVLSLLTSQWTWEHYSVMYLLPLAILVDRGVRAAIAPDAGVGARVRAAAILALVGGTA